MTVRFNRNNIVRFKAYQLLLKTNLFVYSLDFKVYRKTKLLVEALKN